MKKLPEAKAIALNDLVAEIDRLSDDRVVVIGPMRWQPDDRRLWYFTISYMRRGEFCSIRMDTPGYVPPATIDNIPEVLREVCDNVILLNSVNDRGLVIKALRTLGITVHGMTDELAQARLCEWFWPSECTKRLRRAVETELRRTPSWPNRNRM
jgi:hypothetical protein